MIISEHLSPPLRSLWSSLYSMVISASGLEHLDFDLIKKKLEFGLSKARTLNVVMICYKNILCGSIISIHFLSFSFSRTLSIITTNCWIIFRRFSAVLWFFHLNSFQDSFDITDGTTEISLGHCVRMEKSATSFHWEHNVCFVFVWLSHQRKSFTASLCVFWAVGSVRRSNLFDEFKNDF